MNYDDIWLRNQVTNLGRDLDELKNKVAFHNQLLQMQSYRVAKLEEDNQPTAEKPRVEEFKAVDAYRKSIDIVRAMKEDFWFRNIPNDVAKEWVTATIDDIINAIQNRIDRLEVK